MTQKVSNRHYTVTDAYIPKVILDRKLKRRLTIRMTHKTKQIH